VLFLFTSFIYTVDPEIELQNNRSVPATPIQADGTPTPLVDPLAQLKEKYRRLCLLQTVSTITDYTCQFTQIALTLPQVIGHPSEEAGTWLNGFNLAAGIIAISQIPTKKWIQSRLAETAQTISKTTGGPTLFKLIFQSCVHSIKRQIVCRAN
jgi:hypothetical protein